MRLTIVIPDLALSSARMTEEEAAHEAKKELALAFYGRGFLSLGKVVELAETTRREFESWLAERKIERPLSEEELERELASAG